MNFIIGITFVLAAVIVVITVNLSMRQQALVEAQSKARIILDRNLATHAYFSQVMKPSIFAWSEPFRTKEYFDHTWMSSTYAIREIEKYFKSLNPSGYYFRDAAIDARSPENEADEYERAFITKLNADERLESESVIRKINGRPYLVVLRKGEVMEASCLRCHSDPRDAPKGLTDYYGSTRSFNRKAGDAVSTVSLRIPLSEAYAAANVFSFKLSGILLIVLACLFVIQCRIYRRYLMEPLGVMRDKANEIAMQEGHLGEEISRPFGRELAELKNSFNEMSVKLRHDRDHLEELVNERTEALRESEEELRLLFKSMINAFVLFESVFDDDGNFVSYRFVYINDAYEGITGVKNDEVKGRTVHEVWPGTEPEWIKRYGEVAVTGVSSTFDMYHDPTKKLYHCNVYRPWDAKDRFCVIFEDITDRKLAEEKIRSSLLEKETLLKEIHHRVKNNLQVISSLLDLQSSYLKDEKAREMLHNSMDRIKTMARVHTMLYQSADMSRIDFGGFIGDLAARLQQSHGAAVSPVDIHVDVPADISLTIETSIPCGLILNELVSNALKHAFPEGKGGDIHITMKAQGDRFVLTVSDNGTGFPSDVDFRNTKTLGLELVNLLAAQIYGIIDMRVDTGTTWTITFPAAGKEG